MNGLFQSLDLQSVKPLLTVALLPPVPFLLLVLLAAALLRRHRRIGWLLIGVGVAGLWLSTTSGAALALARIAGLHPPPLAQPAITTLAERVAQAGGADRSPMAIVVLGGGRERLAPEYAAASLSDASLQRLRYGLWLARQTGAPVAFSGGRGWQQPTGDSEAAIAAAIAATEYQLPLRWVEDRSRDTRENARHSIELLRNDGVDTVLLVTDGWHMRRALRAFRASAGSDLRIVAAPMGLSYDPAEGIYRWLPSASGFENFNAVLREVFGLLAGA
ncbi:YdcF family protein [Piscinibacter sakaiensis]|uniref:YdcF family protein n=1 Tax=Piscinibacter sakaiensis TaxID=1547922 RepID=UPI003AAE332E